MLSSCGRGLGSVGQVNLNFGKFYSTSTRCTTDNSTQGENPSTRQQAVSSTFNRLSSEFCEWFTGFVDAEGLFTVHLVDNKRPQLSFRITLHKDDQAALKFIQDQLGAGIILLSRETLVFYLQKVEDLENVLFPLLDSYPLNSTKHMDYLIFKKAHFIRKDRSYRTPEGLNHLKYLLSQLNNKRTDFTYPENHTFRITPNWVVGFIEGDGMFTGHVDKETRRIRLGLSINQTIAEEKPMDAIIIFWKNLSQVKEASRNRGGSCVNVYKKISEPTKPTEQPSIRITISDTVFLYITILPLFNYLNFQTKKRLDYEDWSIVVQISFLGLHLNEEGISLALDLISRMNNSRLSTHKNFKEVEISKDRIDNVLSLSPAYEYRDGERYLISSGKKVSLIKEIKLIDLQGSELVFPSLSECARVLNEDRKRIARYVNQDKLFVCKNNKNNKYYVVK